VAPPSRQSRTSEPDSPPTLNLRIATPAALAGLSDTEYLKRRGYSPAALETLTAVAGGPPALERLRSLDATWTRHDHSSVDRLLRAVNRLRETQPENEDARAQTVTALLQLYKPLTDWGYSDADLLDIVGWLKENDPSRSAALNLLHVNREWLEQRAYLATDMRYLVARPDFAEILDALKEYHGPLRAAKFASSHIAEAAGNEAGADSIAALAEHHSQLREIGYSPSLISRYAYMYGPQLIELLAGERQLTTESGGPLGMAELISILDEPDPERVVDALRARADALRSAAEFKQRGYWH